MKSKYKDRGKERASEIEGERGERRGRERGREIREGDSGRKNLLVFSLLSIHTTSLSVVSKFGFLLEVTVRGIVH